MNKYLLRILTLLLLPILLVDPATAGGLVAVQGGLHRPCAVVRNDLFSTQALSERVVMAVRSDNPHPGSQVRRLAMVESTSAAQTIAALHRRWVATPNHTSAGRILRRELMSQMQHLARTEVPRQDDAKIGHTLALFEMVWSLLGRANLISVLGKSGIISAFLDQRSWWIKRLVDEQGEWFAYKHKMNLQGESLTEEDRRELVRLFRPFAEAALAALDAANRDYFLIDWLEDLRPTLREFMYARFQQAFYAAQGEHDARALPEGRLLAMIHDDPSAAPTYKKVVLEMHIYNWAVIYATRTLIQEIRKHRKSVPITLDVSSSNFAGEGVEKIRDTFSDLPGLTIQTAADATPPRADDTLIIPIPSLRAPLDLLKTGRSEIAPATLDRLRQELHWVNRPTLILGSVYGPEVIDQLKIFKTLQGIVPDLQLVVVPRNTNALRQSWENIIEQAMGHNPAVRTGPFERVSPGPKSSVLLVLTQGELRAFYALAAMHPLSAAIVGGSFVGFSHNLMEPILEGLPTFYGPGAQNSSNWLLAAIADLTRTGVSVPSVHELGKVLMRAYKNPSMLAQMKMRTQDAHQEVQHQISGVVLPLIDSLAVDASDPAHVSANNLRAGESPEAHHPQGKAWIPIFLKRIGVTSPAALRANKKFQELSDNFQLAVDEALGLFVGWLNGRVIKMDLAIAFSEYALERARSGQPLHFMRQDRSLQTLGRWLAMHQGIYPSLVSQSQDQIRVRFDPGGPTDRILILEVINSLDKHPSSAHYVRLADDHGVPVFHVQIQQRAIEENRTDEVLTHEIIETQWRVIGAPEPVADRMAREKRLVQESNPGAPWENVSLDAPGMHHPEDPPSAAPASPHNPWSQRWSTIAARSRRFVMGLIQWQARRAWMADQGYRASIKSYELEWKRVLFVKTNERRDSLSKEVKSAGLFFVGEALAGVLGVPLLFVHSLLHPVSVAIDALWRGSLRVVRRPRPISEWRVRHARQTLERAPDILSRKAVLRGMPWAAIPLANATIAELDQLSPAQSPPSTATRYGERERDMDIIGGSLIASFQWRLIKKTHAQDEPLIRYLLNHITAAEDPWVIRSAISSLRHVYPKLSIHFQEEFVRRCSALLRESTLEVTCSAASWGLREAGDARSIHDLWEILNDGRHDPWVQAYQLEALAYLLAQHPVNSYRLPDIQQVADRMLAWAGQRQGSVALRVNALKALVQLDYVTPAITARLEEILLEGPDGTVKETALWALARMQVADRSIDSIDSLVRFLTRFLEQGPQGRQNIVLNDYARYLLSAFSVWVPENSLREHASHLARTESSQPSADLLSEVNFVTVEALDEELSGQLTTLYTGKVIQKRQELWEQGHGTLHAESFLEDRDQLPIMENGDLKPVLRTDLFLKTVDRLARGLPVRTWARDPARGKRKLDMDRVVEPYPGQPVDILGSESDLNILRDAWNAHHLIHKTPQLPASAPDRASLPPRDLMLVPMKPVLQGNRATLGTITSTDKRGQREWSRTARSVGFSNVLDRAVQAMNLTWTDLERKLDRLGITQVDFVLDPALDAPEETFITYEQGTAVVHIHPTLTEAGLRNVLLGAVIKGWVNVTTKVKQDEIKEHVTTPLFIKHWINAITREGVEAALGTLGEGARPMLQLVYSMFLKAAENDSVYQIYGQPGSEQAHILDRWLRAAPEEAAREVGVMMSWIERIRPGFLFIGGNPAKGRRDLMATPMDDLPDAHVAVYPPYVYRVTSDIYAIHRSLIPGNIALWGYFKFAHSEITSKRSKMQGVAETNPINIDEVRRHQTSFMLQEFWKSHPLGMTLPVNLRKIVYEVHMTPGVLFIATQMLRKSAKKAAYWIEHEKTHKVIFDFTPYERSLMKGFLMYLGLLRPRSRKAQRALREVADIKGKVESFYPRSSTHLDENLCYLVQRPGLIRELLDMVVVSSREIRNIQRVRKLVDRLTNESPVTSEERDALKNVHKLLQGITPQSASRKYSWLFPVLTGTGLGLLGRGLMMLSGEHAASEVAGLFLISPSLLQPVLRRSA